MTLFKHFKGVIIGQGKHTARLTVMPFAIPERVYIPMCQGGCAEAKPLVRTGQYVKVGQLIADAAGPHSCPIHASVSGTVTEIANLVSLNGKMMPHIVIESDKRQETADIQPVEPADRTQFLLAMRNSGIIDLSEGQLPLYEQLDFPQGSIDTLLVNGTESEAYITGDHVTMMTYSGDVLAGIHKIMKGLGIPKCILVVSDDEPDVLALYKKHITDIYIEDITLAEIPAGYPNGEELSLIASATGRKLPPQTPAKEAGIAICNVTSVLKFKQYLDSGMPLVSHPVTLDGDAVKRPANVEVPIGTLAGDVIAACRGTVKPVRKIVFGGPMQGIAIPYEDLPTDKTVTGILCFSEDAARVNPETPCIHCGRCLRSCPRNLMPNRIYDAYEHRDMETVQKENAGLCIGCNACSFICPARRPLAYRILHAKEELAAMRKEETSRE